MAVTIDLTGPLEEYVLGETEMGQYPDASAYIRDLIRRDMDAAAAHSFRTVKEHLEAAFATPESEYVEIDAETFLREMKARYT